jgi:beta-phosphoglucomutase
MAFKGAIFDLDGVIVNTVPLHFSAWKKMFAEYGRRFTFRDYKEKVDGIPRIEGARAILTDVSAKLLKEACEKKQRYFRQNLSRQRIKTYRSTLRLMNDLKRRHIKLAVASSSQNTPFILSKIGLDDFFDAEVFGKQIKRGKPHPEIFLKSAKKLKLKPQECVVFEDAKMGVEAAKRGGFICVGINRLGDSGFLKGADIVVKDLKEVGFKKLNLFFKS